MPYRCQLVVQFDAVSLSDFDALVALEEVLIEALGDSAEVDGHDFGSSEFNIFIFTDDPKSTFESVRGVFGTSDSMRKPRAGWRDVNANEYVPLWPPELSRFIVT